MFLWTGQSILRELVAYVIIWKALLQLFLVAHKMYKKQFSLQQTLSWNEQSVYNEFRAMYIAQKPAPNLI